MISHTGMWRAERGKIDGLTIIHPRSREGRLTCVADLSRPSLKGQNPPGPSSGGWLDFIRICGAFQEAAGQAPLPQIPWGLPAAQALTRLVRPRWNGAQLTNDNNLDLDVRIRSNTNIVGSYIPASQVVRYLATIPSSVPWRATSRTVAMLFGRGPGSPGAGVFVGWSYSPAPLGYTYFYNIPSGQNYSCILWQVDSVSSPKFRCRIATSNIST